MIGAACMVTVARIETVRRGRRVECALVRYDVAVCEVPGEPVWLLDTRTGETWEGAFTAEEQAEADAGLERARVMRRYDEAWRAESEAA